MFTALFIVKLFKKKVPKIWHKNAVNFSNVKPVASIARLMVGIQKKNSFAYKTHDLKFSIET